MRTPLVLLVMALAAAAVAVGSGCGSTALGTDGGGGVSNNKLRTLGPPTWEDSKVRLAGSLTLDVGFHY